MTQVPMTAPAHDLVTLRGAAESLGVAPDTLRAQVHRKRLDAFKVGRDWVLRRVEVDRYAQESLGRPGRRPGKRQPSVRAER